MPTKVPDLTPTIIDDETGEILHQGVETPEADAYRAEIAEKWKKIYAERHAQAEAEEAQTIEAKKAELASESPAPTVVTPLAPNNAQDNV